VPAELELKADRDQIARVFLNLMRNSLQAIAPARGQEAKGEARITVSAKRDADMAVIWIQDNGPGVSAAARQRLFEPFSISSSRRGSGLGLAIAADILRAHDGDISLVDSVYGARFKISLPDH
jgi:signal transduction histidine kinase